MKNVKVEFKFEDSGNCRQIYKDIDSAKYYARMESGVWYTVSKADGLYESDYMAGDNINFQVSDKKGNVYFEESNLTKEDRYPFMRELCKRVSKRIREEKGLLPDEECDKWVAEDMEKYNFKDYKENWLWSNKSTISSEIVEKFDYLGESMEVVKEHYKHNICGKEWIEYFIVSNETGACEGICGGAKITA